MPSPSRLEIENCGLFLRPFIKALQPTYFYFRLLLVPAKKGIPLYHTDSIPV